MKKAKGLQKKFARMTSLALVLLLTASALSACKKDNSTPSSSSGQNAPKATASASASQTGSTKQTGTASSKDNATASTTAGTDNVGSIIGADGQILQGDQQTTSAGNDGSYSNGDQTAAGNTEEVKMDLQGSTITWSTWTDPYADTSGQITTMSILLKRLEAAQQKYNFKLDIIVNDAYTQRDNFITNATAGIFYADVLSTQTRFAYPRFVSANLILPVDQYYDFTADPIWMRNAYFVNGCNWNGRYYGIARDSGGTGPGIVFNKDNLALQGLPNPIDLINSKLWTWDKFLDMCQQFTKDLNGDGISDTYGVIEGSLGTALVYSNGGRLIDEKRDGTINFGLTETQSVKALQFLSDLYNVYKVAKAKGSGTAGLMDFQNALFYAVSPNGLTELQKVGLTNTGWVPMAKGPDISDCQNVATAANITVFSTQTKYPKEVIRIFADACTNWDPSKPDYISPYDAVIAANLSRTTDPGSLDMIARYSLQVGIDKTLGFDGLDSAVVKNIYQPVSKLTSTVAAAIEAYRSAGQDLINSQLR